jgi:translocation and assembly module TamB
MVLAGLVLLVTVLIFVAVRAGFVREKVRDVIETRMAQVIDGDVSIREVRGGLLGGITLVGVTISGSDGGRFLSLDTLSARYSLPQLFRLQLLFSDVRLVNARVLLDQSPESWNYERIFRLSKKAPSDSVSRIVLRLDRVTIVDGDIALRTQWRPDSLLRGADRARAVAAALSDSALLRVERAGTHFQMVQEYHHLDATFPEVRLMSPQATGMYIHIGHLSAMAAVVKGETTAVRKLAAEIDLGRDSLRATNLTVNLPASSLTGNATYAFARGRANGDVRVDSLSASDFAALRRMVPDDLRAAMSLRIDAGDSVARYDVSGLVVRTRGGSVRGDISAVIPGSGGSAASVAATLALRSISTEIARSFKPGIALPVTGTLDGTVSARGPLRNVHLESNLTFTDALSGSSNVRLSGGVGWQGRLEMHDLDVTLSPLQVALAGNFINDFPLDGQLWGSATVNGAVGERVAALIDLDLLSQGRLSHVSGNATMTGSQSPSFTAQLLADPVDLSLTNAFAPDAGVRGSVSGPISLSGTLRELVAGVDLRILNGGSLVAQGTFDLAADQIAYDVQLSTERLDLRAVLDSAESTSISTTASVNGRGVSLASAVASLDMYLRPSTYGDIELDSARASASIAGGVLRLGSLVAGAGGIDARASGTFGITDSTAGTVMFTAAVDSLHKLRRWISGDTTSVFPRPSRVAEAYRIARADSARIARETQVQRAISGGPPPTLQVDLPPAIRRDSLAGSAAFAGSATGNHESMGLSGLLAAGRIVARGVTADTIRADVAARVLPSDSLSIGANVIAAGITAAGHSADTLSANLSWLTHHGSADVRVTRGSQQLLEASADVSIDSSGASVNLQRGLFQFDTLSTWRTLFPSRFFISDSVISVDSLALAADSSGSLRLSGRMPRSGAGELKLDVYGLEVGGVLDAFQSDLALRGTLIAGITAGGSLDVPVFSGSAGLVDGHFGNNPLPEVRSLFSYAMGRIDADVSASRRLGPTFLTGEAHIPLDLDRQAGERTGPAAAERPIDVHLVLNELPLELVPDLTENLSAIAGRAVGEVTVSGTTGKPVILGSFSIHDGSAIVNALGVQLSSVNASLRMDGDTLRIESFTANSGTPLTLAGSIGLSTPSVPEFDLHLMASEAYVLNNENGRLRANLDLTMKGPLTGTSITGSARVTNGVVYAPRYSAKDVLSPDDSLFRLVADSTDARLAGLIPQPSAFMDNLRVQIALDVARDTWVRTPEANVELFSDGPLVIAMHQGTASLVLEGVLSTDRGQYSYSGTRFEIKRGSARFIGGNAGLNPTLQLAGEHEVQLPARGKVKITVLISGTMLQPVVRLESDAQPPLSQSDMLSYLAFGKSSSSLLQVGASGLAGDVGVFGTGKLAGEALKARALGTLMDQLEREAEGAGMRSLGLDLLDITPAETYTEIARGDILSFLRATEVEAGRYFTRRTFVSGQLRLSATPGVRAIHRAPKGYRVELAWEPRILLRAPTLSEQRSITRRSFGFLILREWRF